MNTDLIKQLELALAVERGEVPLSEIQRRLRHEYISSNKEFMQWHACHDHHTPEIWKHNKYEYRRKPKPLEKWLMFYSDNSARSFESFEEAKAAMEQEKNSYLTPVGIIHMREVTNE